MKWIVGLSLTLGVAVFRCSGPKGALQKATVARPGTLLVFSDIRGALKPCGCSPDLKRGGVDRVAAFVRSERARLGEATVVLHSGNLLVDDEGVPAERAKQVSRRVQAMGDSLRLTGVTAATLGGFDLAQGLPWLEAELPKLRTPLIVTNATGQRWRKLAREHMLVDVGSERVGLIGLVPMGCEGITDPLPAARKAAAALRANGATLVVALSSLGLRQAKRLLRKRSGIDLLHAAGQDLKALVTDEVEPMGGAWLLQSFVQGGQVGRVTITPGAGTGLSYVEPGAAAAPRGASFTYALSPIGWDLPQYPAVVEVMAAYDRDLKGINLASAGTLPPLKPGQASYVGVEKCLECHEDTKTFWEKDQHKVAWQTLVVDGKTFDLECVSCHVTGYGKPGGSILGALKNLKTVQCEACHGPGSAHSEEGDVELITREVPESHCVGCHNPKHSTGFNYERYKSRLMVPGHGK